MRVVEGDGQRLPVCVDNRVHCGVSRQKRWKVASLWRRMALRVTRGASPAATASSRSSCLAARNVDSPRSALRSCHGAARPSVSTRCSGRAVRGVRKPRSGTGLSVAQSNHHSFAAPLADSLGVPAVVVLTGGETGAPCEAPVAPFANGEHRFPAPSSGARGAGHRQAHRLEEFCQFVLSDVVARALVVVELVGERAVALDLDRHDEVDLAPRSRERDVPDSALFLS